MARTIADLILAPMATASGVLPTLGGRFIASCIVGLSASVILGVLGMARFSAPPIVEGVMQIGGSTANFVAEQACFLSAFSTGAPVAVVVAIANGRVLAGWLIDLAVAKAKGHPLPDRREAIRATASILLTGAGFALVAG